MAQSFEETAHRNIDPKVYADNFTHIFEKHKCPCGDCVALRSPSDTLIAQSAPNSED